MGPANLVRIRLRYADLAVFIEKFAPNVTRGGVFLASRNVQPVGTVVDFEIQLMNGDVALAGQGKVTWVKEYDAAQPNRPYGMGVQFVNVGQSSRAILARLLRKKSGALPIQRGLTGPLATLGSAADAGTPGSPTAATVASPATAGGAPNGRPAIQPAAPPALPPPVPIDTSVDIAAELGVDEATLRLAMDRRRSIVIRPDDELAELLRRDPPEPATIAQALADLPRLLDPQNSRRRGASGFRVPEVVVPPGAATVAPGDVSTVILQASRGASSGGAAASATPATAAASPADAAETTHVRDELPAPDAAGAVLDDAGGIPQAVGAEPAAPARTRSGRRQN